MFEKYFVWSSNLTYEEKIEISLHLDFTLCLNFSFHGKL